MKQATSKALRLRISKLCKNFQVGRCLHLSEKGCKHGPHDKKRFSRAHLTCASLTDPTYMCRLGRDCPYRGHVNPSAPPPAGGNSRSDGDGDTAEEMSDAGEGVQAESGS